MAETAFDGWGRVHHLRSQAFAAAAGTGLMPDWAGRFGGRRNALLNRIALVCKGPAANCCDGL